MDPTTLLAQVSLATEFGRVLDALGLIFKLSPYWGPPVLAVVFWHVWLRYIRARFIAEQQYMLLEIRPPAEIMKSPAAMQAVFDALFNKGGESTFVDRLWFGKVRLWYSFEIVSLEGQVHLYIWTRAAFRRHIERSFYAHYPDVEILPVDDYALRFPFTLESYNLYGVDYQLAAPIGVPIKTYTDYHLDQTSTKEEQKVDPMTHLLEFGGSMGKGENLWIQIVARAHKQEDLTFGAMRNTLSYKDLAAREIARIRKSPEETVVFPDGGTGKTLSDSQIKRIQAMNRISQSGTVWDVGIRSIYMAQHEHFDGTTISGLMTMWQPFGSPLYNSIVPIGNRWQNKIDYPWQDFNNYRQNKMKVEILDAYRRRSWFHAPYAFRSMILTSEELATIYHLPGSVAKTPTMQRIESLRAQAPTNLPV